MRVQNVALIGLAALMLFGCDSRGPKERELDQNLSKINDPTEKAVMDGMLRPMMRTADQEYARATPAQQRLMEQIERVGKQTCDRCQGDGYVDAKDIIRLGKVGWLPGKCALCGGTGTGIASADSSTAAPTTDPFAPWNDLSKTDLPSLNNGETSITWQVPLQHPQDEPREMEMGKARVLGPEYILTLRLTPGFTTYFTKAYGWSSLRPGGWITLLKRDDVPARQFLLMADIDTRIPIRHRSKSIAKSFTQSVLRGQAAVQWARIEMPVKE